jgi:YHS domain-containing protein
MEDWKAGSKECPICGKTFYPAPEHLYKLVIKGKTYHYCSYTCYRVDQKKLERKTKSKRNHRTG